MKYSAAFILLLGTAAIVRADYVVDIDLGVLPAGFTDLVGTTAATTTDPGPPPVTIGGNDNSLFVKDESGNALVLDGGDQTWGNEIVYQFELSEASFVAITSNSIQGDADFFLLDGLATSVDGDTGKLASNSGLDVALLDGAPPETREFAALAPGIYYLAVENYDGVDPNLNPGDTIFDVTLNVRAAEAIDLAIEIGSIAAAGSPLTLNTFGSAFNTELAIYDIFGNLLFENDDAGGDVQSEISLPEGLLEGTYYAVIAGHDTTFEEVFGVSTGGEVGDWTFNYPLGPVLDPGSESGTTQSGSLAGEVQFILFSIAPLPINPIDLGVIANEDEPFFVDTTGSGFDTQLAMFDSGGFWLAFNDDINIDVGNFQSELFFEQGLLPGVYYLALAGFPHEFGDGFFVSSAGGAEGGGYQLNHPLGVEDGVLNSNQNVWFSFGVAALPRVDVSEIAFDPATNQVTLSWDSPAAGPFTIWAGNASDFAALQAAPDNVLPIEAMTGATSPATFTVPVDLQGSPQVFFQVSD